MCNPLEIKTIIIIIIYIVAHGFMEIILKLSTLEASTRARTGDSAETIKLFENIFFFFFSNEQNSQQNRYG